MSLIAHHKETVFHVGDTVKVFYHIVEREKIAGRTKRSVEEKVKKRIQPFEGVVISIKGSKENKSFTVRHIASHHIGVERVFPIISPWIEKIEVKQRGIVRRSKLYYLKSRGNLEIRAVVPTSKKQNTRNKTVKKKNALSAKNTKDKKSS